MGRTGKGTPVEVTRSFRGDPVEVPSARQFVARALEREGREATDAALLVTSELVSNAVLHGSGPVELHVAIDDGALHLEVHDAGGHLPLAPASMPGPAATCGRGLALVQRLARSWGSRLDPRGRTIVWADVAAPLVPGSAR